MKIKYTRHALVDKFAMLKKHKFQVGKRFISEVISHPEHEDKQTDFPKVIASKTIDTKHVLRVVYRVENDTIWVITFYPAEKGRYY